MQTSKSDDLRALEEFLSSRIQRVAAMVCLAGILFSIFVPRLSSIFDFQMIYGYAWHRKAEIYNSVWQDLRLTMIWVGGVVAVLWPKIRLVWDWTLKRDDAEVADVQDEIRTEMTNFEKVAKALDSGDIGQGEYDYKKAAFDMRMEELRSRLKKR